MVGLIGKVPGPIGLAKLIGSGEWPITTIILCLTNDLIWWIPFGLYLYDAWPVGPTRYCADKQGEGTTLNTLEAVYYATWNYSKALNYFQRALNLNKEIADKQREGMSLNNLGTIYDSMGDYQKALSYYQEALKISQEIGDKAVEEINLANLGYLHERQGAWAEAVTRYQQAIDLFEEIRSKAGRSKAKENLLAQNIAEYMLAEKATKVVLRNRSRNYRYIHLSTHGLLDSQHAMYSGIAFWDGFLQVYEIFNLELSVDLITLSACETGLGELKKGEGVIGLTRAFMYAGPPSVMVSLWRVNDELTAELMREFYGKVKKGMSKVKVLQEAKQAVMRQKKEIKSNKMRGSPYCMGIRFSGPRLCWRGTGDRIRLNIYSKRRK